MEIIALASLIVSFSVAIWTAWIHYQQIGMKNRLDQQQEKINSYTIRQFQNDENNRKSALVCAEAFRKEAGWRVRIENKGKGTARNIRIQSEDILSENSGIRLTVEQSSYPLLNEGEFFDIQMMLFINHIPSPIITLVWDDDSGMDRKREQALNLVF